MLRFLHPNILGQVVSTALCKTTMCLCSWSNCLVAFCSTEMASHASNLTVRRGSERNQMMTCTCSTDTKTGMVIVIMSTRYSSCSSYSSVLHRGFSMNFTDLSSVIMVKSHPYLLRLNCSIFLKLLGIELNFSQRNSMCPRNTLDFLPRCTIWLFHWSIHVFTFQSWKTTLLRKCTSMCSVLLEVNRSLTCCRIRE